MEPQEIAEKCIVEYQFNQFSNQQLVRRKVQLTLQLAQVQKIKQQHIDFVKNHSELGAILTLHNRNMITNRAFKQHLYANHRYP